MQTEVNAPGSRWMCWPEGEKCPFDGETEVTYINHIRYCRPAAQLLTDFAAWDPQTLVKFATEANAQIRELRDAIKAVQLGWRLALKDLAASATVVDRNVVIEECALVAEGFAGYSRIDDPVAEAIRRLKT